MGCINIEIMMSDELLAERVYSRFTKTASEVFSQPLTQMR
jgi:hypothetical protein